MHFAISLATVIAAGRCTGVTTADDAETLPIVNPQCRMYLLSLQHVVRTSVLLFTVDQYNYYSILVQPDVLTDGGATYTANKSPS